MWTISKLNFKISPDFGVSKTHDIDLSHNDKTLHYNGSTDVFLFFYFLRKSKFGFTRPQHFVTKSKYEMMSVPVVDLRGGGERRGDRLP